MVFNNIKLMIIRTSFMVLLHMTILSLSSTLALKLTPSSPLFPTTAAKFNCNSEAKDPSVTRRDTLRSIIPSIAALNLLNAPPSFAATETENAPSYAPNGLASRLSKRDPSQLRNSVFNIPPSEQTYPPFLRGTWDVSASFLGYIFPSKTISKQTISSNVQIPGFQKVSIAQIGDVGRELTRFQFKVDPDTGHEDRAFNLKQTLDAHLGYDAMDNVIYDGGGGNPNRLSINFKKYQTRNAERIELFCNARESELVQMPQGSKIFVCSEYIRQVTFGYGQEFGVARQVIGNYAHFWTWREQEDSNTLTGNLLTAVYLDPSDALYFDEPSKPVAVYSHDLVAKRSVSA